MSILKHSLEVADTVAVPGGEIAYRLYKPHNAVARERTPLIVLHGGPGGSHASMYDCLNVLADDRPVVFYDQLGSYFSPAPHMGPEHLVIGRFAAEIGCLMGALGFSKANLLGQSWGSAVSTHFAAHHPERVEKLILSGPHISTPAWVRDCNALLAALPQEVQDTIKRCEAEGRTDSQEYKDADDFFSKRHFLRCDPWPDRLFAHREKHNAKIYNAMWGPSEFTCTGTLHDMDLTPLLPKLSMPVLLICGEYDTAQPETVKGFGKLMPNAKVVVIPDSGHVSYGDQNEAYLSAVTPFLN